MKIIADNKIPFLKGVFEPYAEVLYLPGKETTPAEVRDADALLTRTRTRCDASLLEGSSVRAIATATIGFDHIDTAWCESAGIEWSNAPGCNSGSVAQYIASVLVTVARRRGLDFSKMTLGVVGVGNVGSKVANVGRRLGMKVLLNDPPRARREGAGEFVELDTICREADIITLHVPLQKDGEDATWHLFDAARIASLGPDRILFNSSRGPVVDNAALKAALAAGQIKAAVLDVWENEPDIDRELMSLLDITTPHIAGYSADGKANGTTASVRMIARCLGLPLTGWKASDIPAPAQPLEFTVDAAGLSLQEVMSAAILHTYEVSADSDALRADPSLFEKLRGDYPVRREFGAFTLTILGGTPAMEESLKGLGFNIIIK